MVRGIRFKITFVYSTLFGLFICIFAFIITQQYLETSRQDFDSALLNYAIDLSDDVRLDDSGFQSLLKIHTHDQNKRFPFALGKTLYMVRSLDGKILIKNQPHMPDIPYNPDLAHKANYTHRFLPLIIENSSYRALNLKVTNQRNLAMILQVATPSLIIDQQADRQSLINLITIPLLIIVSSIVSYLIAGNALDPVKDLTAAANNIAAENLSLRVPEVDTGDEIGELSRTLNHLLERLERSFKAQEHFVSNASHQLNTPLAIIKGELDVLQSKDRNLEEITKFHKSLREEIERLIELVKNMLLVSRVESGQETFILKPTRLDELLLGVSSRLSSKAREKRIIKRFNMAEELFESDNLIVQGEKQLLDSLFENLLDNAIKYSPEDSVIKIDIKAPEGALEVWLQDQGPGIQDDDLEKILTSRFYRGSKVLMPGTGIGLTIAYQIASLHHAKISYSRVLPQGSLFVIKFPK